MFSNSDHIFNNSFILVWVMVDLEPIQEMLVVRQKYILDGMPSQIF